MKKMLPTANTLPIKPFLRWVGGKQNLVRQLARYVPPDIHSNGHTYFEPFLGAGSLFFHVRPRKATLSDANRHLIHCYRALRDHPERILRYLQTHARQTSEDYYYRVRDEFNNRLDTLSIAQATRFFYLNRACFNGIFRVNKQGQFNVPYGNKANLMIPSHQKMMEISRLLRTSKLGSFSYEGIVGRVKSGDFVYLDPPYPPLNGSSYFTHYTEDRFGSEQQSHVAETAQALSDKGCRVLVSNADTCEMRRLYSDWNTHPVKVTRFVSCKSERHYVGELIITNF